MKSDVKRYITKCEKCQKAKYMNKELQRRLQPFPAPEKNGK